MKSKFFTFFRVLVPVIWILAIVVPFYHIASYSYYASDDFFFGQNVIDRGFIGAQSFCYTMLNGRYSATFFMSLLPLARGEDTLPFLAPIVIITNLIISIFVFSRCLLKNSDLFHQLLLSFVCLIGVIGNVKNPSEVFFWAAGGVTYGLSLGFFFYFLAGLIVILNGKTNWKVFALIVLNQILLIGCNETVVIISSLILGLVFLYSLISTRKLNYKLGILIVTGIIFSLIIIKAPGNNERLKQSLAILGWTTKHDVKINGEQTYDYLIEAIRDWHHNAILYITSVIFLLILIRTRAGLNYYRHYLWFFVLPLPCILFISAFPTFYALGVPPPDRTTSVYLTFMIISNFFLTYLLVGLFQKLIYKKRVLSVFTSRYFLLLLLALLPVVVTSCYDNNVLIAYKNWLDGSLEKMKEEMDARLKIIKRTKDDVSTVYHVRYQPYMVYHGELGINGDNLMLSIFYHKKNIIMLPFVGKSITTYNYDFDGASSDYLTGMVTSKDTCVSAPNSIAIQGPDNYGANVEKNISTIYYYDLINAVKISFDVLSKDSALNYDVYLLIKKGHGDKVLDSRSKVFEHKNLNKNTWERRSFELELTNKELFNPRNKISVFVHNKNGAKIYIDNLQLDFFY